MIRYLSFVAVALLVAVSFELYNGASRVKDEERELAGVKAQIAREQESIRVLKAEWTFLNQPDRLQTLARDHLALAPTAASQIVMLASLPARTEASTDPSPVVDASELPTKEVPNAPQPRFKPALKNSPK